MGGSLKGGAMKRFIFFAAGVGALAFLLATPTAVYSAPPSNDNFVDATVIASLPFTSSVDITEATTEPGEPIAYPGEIGRTVWYSFTPTSDSAVQVGPVLSPPDPGTPPTACDLNSYRFLVVYRAEPGGFSGLVPIAGGQWQSAGVNTIQMDAGTTYYVQGGQTWALWCGQNSFSLSVSLVLPPPNDDFADATAFTSVPFSDSPDLTAATVEPDEPISCGASFSQSAWYAFTPATSGSFGAYGISNVAVYTGTSLGDLTNVACADWPGLYFWAETGTTYYLQIWGGGVSVDVVPPPAADFTYSPGDPSAVEDIVFSYWNGGYWDPTVTDYSWNFGDGTTGTGSPVSHTFARDGDYEVTITVEARGGRTNTATKTVQVRTHDVTLLSLVAPKKGVVGKQGVITVGIGNVRYPEMVQVDLYKVTPQGDVLIGTSIQSVGVMKLKKTVTFAFNYVFTTDDALLGKVPFRAVASIQGPRDAVDSDNSATSPPTLVPK
jgi:hypothetical protein